MRSKTLAGVLAGLALIGAGCGDDAETSSATEPAVTEPAVTEPAVTEPAVTEPNAEAVTRIVSLSPTATEMIYAIGAGDQVIGVDDFSNYPPEAADKMQGLDGFNPNAEAIAALEPDLVLTDGTNPDFLAQLDTLGIAHWEGSAATTFDDVYTQIEQLGAATGRIAEAAELVGRMQTDIDAAVATLPTVDPPLTYYHELDASLFSVTSDTFIGLVYGEMGLVNIADAVGDGNPYPQLSAEFVVASDPDLIFLACTKYCGETPETVAARDGWGALSAVANGNVIGLDDDVASRWGPRIVEFIGQVGAAVSSASASAPAG
jgi:iron complex transport system substrate-binding protein